ncbi:MAG: hypothetical protein M1820_004124 [Bogoriella megaspora]|nr:MAG: hypothetical protein M1820_004124 [Bogoriella megaspora]
MAKAHQELPFWGQASVPIPLDQFYGPPSVSTFVQSPTSSFQGNPSKIANEIGSAVSEQPPAVVTTQGPSLSRMIQSWQPWRYKGYPALSKFMASSDDAFALRRFGKLHARTILMLQNKIARLEAELDEDDRLCQNQVLSPGEDHLANNGSFRNDEEWRPIGTRKLEELIPLLEKYG